ncbi:MAG: tetratricopeptide repeat protein [Chloroflexota bacterium]|nr:MAG: tetratricopeptide repeat protein [Chloroflexota bacterium]
MPLLAGQKDRVNNLPSETTPFIGRTAESSEIIALLNKPTCRLLTLHGPGGIGKTRLAIQVASTLISEYVHGVCFTSLQSVQSARSLVSAIADALNFPLAGQEDPSRQLLKYLRGKELLLLLDNFEQLIVQNEGAVVEDILDTVPGIKMLVTSRETLNLQREWVYTIKGLSFAGKGQTTHLAESEAVQLFEERACRVQQNFSLANELDQVVRITQLVEGVPLALELAASWTKLLRCHVIADEIANDLDILSTSRGGMPDRHQSVRLIFDQTWSQLNQAEQNVFKRLAVFRGGFQREAAERVAGATLPLLSVLQDKALLRRRVSDRFTIHELLRQYAAEQLALSESDLWQVRSAHCAYYADFLHRREGDLMGGRQVETTAEIEAELENINAAWQFAVENEDVALIKKAAFTLGNFYQFQSRYAEGLLAFEQASAQILDQPDSEQANLALIDTLMVRSWFYLRFGQPDKIEAAMKQSQAVHRQLNLDPGPGYVTDPEILLAFAELIRGNFDDAVNRAEQARLTNERLDHQENLKFAYFLLTQASMAQGDMEAARRFAEKAFAIVQATGERWFKAYILNALADLAVIDQAYSTAQNYYEESYAIRQAFNDAEGMAVALNHLSEIALRQNDYQEAERYYDASLRLYQDINDVGGLATSYYGLGHTATLQNDYDSARNNYAQALQLAADIRYVPLVMTLLVGIGELLCRVGLVEKGIPLFAFVQHHSAADHETKDRVTQLLNGHKLQVKPEQLSALLQQGQAGDMEMIINTLLTMLPLLDLTTVAADPDGSSTADPNQLLAEPLTERELEVLAYLAEGLSNPEIAERLTIAEGTVKYYTRQIYGKLQVNNRTQAVNQARELGLA